MSGRAWKPKSNAAVRTMGVDQLRAELLSANAANRARGSRLRSMYYMFERVMAEHPGMVSVREDEDLGTQLERARADLGVARGQIATLMSTPRPTDESAEKSTEDSAEASGHMCCVCWENFGVARPVALPCGHVVCEPCCLKQQERAPKCPTCRAPFSSFLPLFL